MNSASHKMNQLLLAIVMVISLVLIAGGVAFGYFLGIRAGTKTPPLSPSVMPTITIPKVTVTPAQGGVYCTMDAKQCPDGSWVGRVPPRCAFAPCPDGTKKTPAPTQEAAGKETVDFAACAVGQGYNRPLGFGSTSLKILQNKDAVCTVEIKNETEGSETVSQCTVPKSLGSITIDIGSTGSDFSAIKPYCNSTSTTHINIQY